MSAPCRGKYSLGAAPGLARGGAVRLAMLVAAWGYACAPGSHLTSQVPRVTPASRASSVRNRHDATLGRIGPVRCYIGPVRGGAEAGRAGGAVRLRTKVHDSRAYLVAPLTMAGLSVMPFIQGGQMRADSPGRESGSLRHPVYAA
jgi:hypothetical protein